MSAQSNEHMKQNICKHCQSERHYSFQCYQNPKRTSLSQSRKPLKRTRVKQIGRVTQKWIDYRHDWIERHGGTTGTWPCELHISPLCPFILTIDTLTLDHILPRSGSPHLRFVDSNIQPACIFCNNAKGSRKLTRDVEN